MDKINLSLADGLEKYLTQYKFGKPVLTGSGIEGTFDAMAVDCPFVFWHKNRFYMMYVGFDGIGYQTGLAASDDLIKWEKLGVILKRDDNAGWDRIGAAGTWILKATNNIYDMPLLKKINGKYWMAYHSYPETGYEQGAAKLGLAWTDDENSLKWHRLPEPIYTWEDGDDWEKGGLYKACIIEHENIYYMFYNAKNNDKRSWLEQIGVAKSVDMLKWERYGNNPILKVSEKGGWDSRFCADPYIVKDKDKWIMFYYGYGHKNAQDGLAVSGDLLNWDKLPEPILRSGAIGEIDAIHAHKPSVLYCDDKLYHSYCAVRKYKEGDIAQNLWNEFRCITFAVSKPDQGGW